MKLNLSTFILLLLTINIAMAQQPIQNNGKFIEHKKGFYENSILKGVEEFEDTKKPEKKKTSFKLDLTGMDVPTSADQFTGYWKNEPLSQGNAGTCWSYSTTSYFETEVYRQTKQQVKLSEIYTAYWEYVEKANRFVQERGNSNFDEGSEANAVTRIMKQYGAMPQDSYSGLLNGQLYHTHSKMVSEMKDYLTSVKSQNAWNQSEVIATIKSIMNHYVGVPPTKVTVNGKDITPLEYLKNVLKINPDDYVDITSIMEKPYWKQVEYEVPDNWWHADNYYNVPLNDYMAIVKAAIRKGYTMSVGGDVSESGFVSQQQIAMVPSYDIPSEFIDENARQFRFSNKTTTDDHGMHLIGYLEKNGKDWYLIKDSGAGSRNCAQDSKNFGYYFFHEDYVKLKMMDFMVHKDMLKDYLTKFASK